jgi:beta-ribofuranosylaminobenzene 5'-phosphate synthase
MIRVQAPSRLHFGLLSLPGTADADWPDLEGAAHMPARHFGGVGMMVDRPGVDLTITPAATWSAEGPGSERALRFARQYCESTSATHAFRLRIDRCAPQHVGLGTGTQLALAVARGMAVALGDGDVTPVQLAPRVGRGLRSALGIHGFAAGGLLVEGGKGPNTDVSPLLCRLPFPDDWPILLILPAGLQGTHGNEEIEAFTRVSVGEQGLRQTDALCRLVLLGLLPALVERDFNGFGEALYDFNRRVGEMFRAWQGDVYAHPRVAHIVQAVRQCGAKGVGQSSWGPSVFAVMQSRQDADQVVARLCHNNVVRSEEFTIAAGDNVGARVVESPSGRRD